MPRQRRRAWLTIHAHPCSNRGPGGQGAAPCDPAADISVNNLALTRQRHESWKKRFGEVVRGWRQSRCWSQEDVSEKVRHQGFEMHQTTVAKIERGTRPLRVAEATAIAEVFEMPIMAVF